MTVGNNPIDRSKLSTKRHILTDKKRIPLSVVISSANTHDIKRVIDVMDNIVIIQPSLSLPTNRLRRRKRLQHLCIDKVYNSAQEKLELIKRGYVLHISYIRKRGGKEGGQGYNTTLLKLEKALYKKMGCRKNKLVV